MDERRNEYLRTTASERSSKKYYEKNRKKYKEYYQKRKLKNKNPQKIKSFKTKWNEVDEVCNCCGQVTKKNTGLTRQNIKKLFKKPTMHDLLVLVMLILIISAAFLYKGEVQQYKDIIENPQELCQIYYEQINNLLIIPNSPLPEAEFIIYADGS